MNRMEIDSTTTSPQVALLAEGKVIFSGKSMMENAIEFYDRIHEWVDGYINEGNEQIELEFDFVYFNSTSAKQILKMLMTLDDSSLKCKVNWKHPEDHDILKFRGAELESMLNMEFNYVPY
ncbi:MAG: SiaC family regulatory phosphoprotein [Crocinitomicaceae bacterium]|nr:DUF1987 family protein [Crocinitomicaceae bacterium]